MHPSGRTGVRFILANPSDPSRLSELSAWYDTYSAAITVPGYLANVVRFENPGASGERLIEGSPEPSEWLEVFESDDPDPLRAYPRAASRAPRAPQIQPQLSESFRRVTAP